MAKKEYDMPFDTYSNIDFEAKVGPIFSPDGEEIPPEVAQGVYRDDNGKILSVCGRGYKPVQHTDVLDPMLQLLKDQGYEIQERDPDKRSLYDLKGQKGAFATIKTQDDGAVMRADIIVGDFVTPTGTTSFLEEGPDTMLRRFTALNSHDGSLAVRATSGYLRLICLNGMLQPDFTASSYGKHTANFSVEALKRQIINAGEMMENDAETFGKYARTPLTHDQAEQLFKKTLAKMPPQPDGTPQHSEKKVRDLLNWFGQQDQTVWGAVNAMTAWATHGELRSHAGQVTARVRRDGEVTRAMRSREFQKLVA
jgi:hypothetical protein